VAAGAPAAELKFLASALTGSPFFGFVVMAAAGFKAGYPDLDLATVLTPEGIAAVERISGQCVSEIVGGLVGADPKRLVRADPGTTEPISGLLEVNSPGARASSVPAFIFHGEADNLIPVATSKRTLDRYCANGTTALRKTYAGKDHDSVVAAARADVTVYFADRLAGRPAASSC
jgi:hypothetical protein